MLTPAHQGDCPTMSRRRTQWMRRDCWHHCIRPGDSDRPSPGPRLLAASCCTCRTSHLLPQDLHSRGTLRWFLQQEILITILYFCVITFKLSNGWHAATITGFQIGNCCLKILTVWLKKRNYNGLNSHILAIQETNFKICLGITQAFWVYMSRFMGICN